MSDGVYVYQFVTKHGSHNQASHAGGKGGAAAGAGEIGEAREDLENRAQGASDLRKRPGEVWTPGQAQMRDDRLKGTADGYKASANYVGNPTRMGALRELMGDSDNAYAKGFTDAVTQAFNDYGTLQG